MKVRDIVKLSERHACYNSLGHHRYIIKHLETGEKSIFGGTTLAFLELLNPSGVECKQCKQWMQWTNYLTLVNFYTTKVIRH